MKKKIIIIVIAALSMGVMGCAGPCQIKQPKYHVKTGLYGKKTSRKDYGNGSFSNVQSQRKKENGRRRK